MCGISEALAAILAWSWWGGQANSGGCRPQVCPALVVPGHVRKVSEQRRSQSSSRQGQKRVGREMRAVHRGQA